jgi:hypothetical protein
MLFILQSIKVNPMARFDDNWENEFKPSWETSVTTNPKKGGGNPSENRVVSKNDVSKF